jgi:hypothetical protein
MTWWLRAATAADMRAVDVAAALPDPSPQDAAAALDREADALLQLGFHSQAERLAHQAAAIRAAHSIR